MLASGYNFWSEWELQEKVDFDGINKIIRVYPKVTELDIRKDVWSAAVRWLAMLNRGYDRFLEPLERTGLDAIPGGQTGDFYFLTNGWKLQVDFAKTAVTGVLFSRDFNTAYYTFGGVAQFAAQVSSIVNTVSTTTNVVTGDIADVWAEQAALDLIDETKYIERYIHIDTEQLTQGIGTQKLPFNTWDAAITYMEANNLLRVHTVSDLTLDRRTKNFVIIGVGNPVIDFNGQDIVGSGFENCQLKGNSIGIIRAQSCDLLHNVQVAGDIDDCKFRGTVEQIGDTIYSGCKSGITGLAYPQLKITSGNAGVRGFIGSIGIIGATAGEHSIGIASDGQFFADATCTGGAIHVRGFPFDITDNSAVGCVVTDETESKRVREMPLSVWEVDKSTITSTSSIGYYISKKLLSLQKFIGLK